MLLLKGHLGVSVWYEAVYGSGNRDVPWVGGAGAGADAGVLTGPSRASDLESQEKKDGR